MTSSNGSPSSFPASMSSQTSNLPQIALATPLERASAPTGIPGGILTGLGLHLPAGDFDFRERLEVDHEARRAARQSPRVRRRSLHFLQYPSPDLTSPFHPSPAFHALPDGLDSVKHQRLAAHLGPAAPGCMYPSAQLLPT